MILGVAVTGTYAMNVNERFDMKTPYNEAGAARGRESVSVMNRMSLKEHLEMYWKFFFERGEKTPVEDLPQERVNLTKLFPKGDKGLRAAWLGHSSLLINIDGFIVLTDPIFQRKVSPVGPVRFNRELPLQVEELEKVDVVIVSHDHYDHLNKYSIQQLAAKAGLFVVPARVGERLNKWGVPAEKIVELNWWQEHRLHEGLTITATPARHFSGRTPFDRNNTLWASWVIRTDRHRVFFSGDSGYFPGFREIGKKYGPFDVAFMECGAYNERWSNVHMFPEQTVQAVQDLGGNILQPVHWATFNLAMHPWYEPIERLIDKVWSSNVRLSVPMIGQVVDYDKPLRTELWWLSSMERSKMSRMRQEVAGVYNLNEAGRAVQLPSKRQ